MIRRFWWGAALALSVSAAAAPLASRQAMISSGVRTTAAPDKPTVYGYPLSVTFTKDDAGKMFEVIAESPKPVTIELWSGDIPRGSATWDKAHKFLGSSGKAPALKPSFRWMIDPGQYTVLFLATVPAGQKVEPFMLSYGKETRTPTEADKAEWSKATAAFDLAQIRMRQAKRAFAPGFTAIATDRNPVTLGQFRGKVVLVTFWSAQAEGFLGDLGYIQGLYNLYHDKGFEMVSFCLDTDQAAFDDYMTKYTPEWKQVWDGRTGNAGIAQKWGVPPLDTTGADASGEQSAQTTYNGVYDDFLIDAQGHIAATNIYREALQKQIKALLAENVTLQEALKNAPDEPADATDEAPAAK
ncbi:MAG TPA: TlpA disulfide reductase family protein [Armatimonadota bacterium]|jgi:cytochrome oxidase Cu insertion factor (SCO1/SenC/PrrC family)